VRTLRLAPCTAAALLAGSPVSHARVDAFVDVVPIPAEVGARPGTFTLTDGAELAISRDRQVLAVAAYLRDLLRNSRGLTLRLLERPGGRVPDGAIALRLDPAAPGESPESYQLDVSPRGVVVSARSAPGLFYGAVTLWQLCGTPAGEATAAGVPQGAAVSIPALHISDTPRFRWRGLMLDSVRHFQSADFILRYIDWMALHKLNVLGWHLTDDQGWRLEIRKYPRLTGVGAWRVPAGQAAQQDIDPATGRPRLHGGFYSQEQVRRIVAHAAARHVTIVPEIDMPGHSTAAIVAYPQLGAAADAPAAVPADWGIYPNVFNLDESTFAFIENVLSEAMRLFPGPYLHIGGDEVVTDQWQASARVRSRMRALGVPDAEHLQAYFTARIGRYLTAHGRRLVGWDEVLEGGAPPGAVVMSWRGTAGALAAASAGHDTVLSPAPVLYLDNRQGGGPGEPPGRGTVVRLEDVYRFDPLPGALAASAGRVLGLQANLWTEHVRTDEQAEDMTWPRAAAVAELGWSPRTRLDWDDFARRLPAEFSRLRALGIRYSADALAPPRTVGPYERHMSQDLDTCSHKLVLNLEDDAPLEGPRAVFLVDIEDPCWMLRAVDLSRVRAITAAVGQVPFNFQIGAARAAIRLDPARTRDGELEVRVDGCTGEPVARLALAPAAGNDAVSVLPAALVPHAGGTHDLCFRFAQRTLDPLWVLDWVQLSP
jgi:hexosaminidase